MDTSVTEASVAELAAMLAERSLSCRELVQLYIDRIEAIDRSGPALNSVVTLNPAALADAEACDERGVGGDSAHPLLGIPVVVKDQVETRGLRTTFGSSGFADYIPQRDATVIE